jgi:hypothetical protein
MKAFFDEGRYVVQIVDQALGEAQTGTPQFILKFTVLERVHDDGDTEAVRNYDRTYYKAITERTIEYLSQDLKNLGFTGTSFRDLDPSSPTFCNLVGRRVEMYCSHEARNGETQEKWGVAFAKRESKPIEAKKIDSAKLRALDNLFGKHLKAGPRPAPAPAPAALPAPANGYVPQAITDDDVPF